MIDDEKTATLPERLARAHVFDQVAGVDLQELARLARRRELAQGEHLAEQGEPWPNVLLLDEGMVRAVMVSPGGHEYMLGAMKPDSVYFHSIFGDEPMPASLVANQPSRVYLWPSNVARPILERNPAALMEIGGMLLKSLRRSSELIYGLAFQPVGGRLAQVLLARIGHQENRPVERDLSLQELAALVATSPEVVSRLLHQFQTEGLLKITRSTILLQDRAGLERLAR